MNKSIESKRKVLFVIPCLQHGGTNRVLEDLLKLLDGNIFELSILCLRSPNENEGYYKQVFSDNYNLIFQNKFLEMMTWSKVMLAIHNRLRSYWGISFMVEFFYRLSAKYIEKAMTPDVVVAFEEGYATMMASFFKCKRIAWVHCDYKSYMNGVRSVIRKEAEYYRHYSNIVCVSKHTSESFASIFNDLRGRVLPIYNPIDVNRIKTMSEEKLTDPLFDTNYFSIISVGRYAYEKQFYKIPDIIAEMDSLTNRKMNYKWYVIGDGYSIFINETIKKIKEYKIEDRLFLMGAKDNPYPYIKASDLMVCTSSSEAYPTVVNEAKVFGVPVVSNNFPSAREIISDSDGCIADFAELPTVILDYINKGKGIYNRCNIISNNHNASIKESVEKLLL